MNERHHITVVGVGALGSHFVQFARSIPGAEFMLVDFDHVEAKNTLSQFHGKPGVGELKVEALKGTLQFLWGMRASVYPQKLDTANAEELLGHADLIVDALDNAEGRRVIQRWARERNTRAQLRARGQALPAGFVPVEVLHGALAPAAEGFGQVVWDERFTPEDGAAGGVQVTCEAGEALPFIGVVASYMALSAQAWLERQQKLNWQIGATSGARRF